MKILLDVLATLLKAVVSFVIGVVITILILATLILLSYLGIKYPMARLLLPLLIGGLMFGYVVYDWIERMF